MKLKKYTLDELKLAIQNSFSYRETLLKLKVIAAGGNYHVLKKAIKFFNLDISHFTHNAWNKNKQLDYCYIPLDKYLESAQPPQSNKVKLKLLREKIFNHTCSSCNQTTWLDKSIPLELDHIDGNRNNYKLSNLRLLCPNCHAQTPTYRGKNKSPIT